MIAIPGLEPLAPRRGSPPPTALIVGAGGFGKSSALDGLADAYAKQSVETFRVTGRRLEMGEPFAALDGLVKIAAEATTGDVRAAVLDRLGGGPWLVLVDDAHLLHDSTLAVLAGVADRAGRSGGVIATHRPSTSAALVALGDALCTTRPAIVLRPWTAESVVSFALTLGLDALPAMVEAVVRSTGGSPRLVAAMITGASEDGALDAMAGGSVPFVRAVSDAVQRELRTLGDAAGAVGLAWASGVPASVVASVSELAERDAADALRNLEAAGFVGDDSVFVPAVAAAVLATASPVEVAALRARAADALMATGAPDVAVAPHLAAAGARSDADRAVLTRAAEAVVAADPALALAWLDAAGTPETAAGLVAEARLRSGDFDGAAELADRVLASGEVDARAAAVAATVAASRGQLRLAAGRWALVADDASALARVAVLTSAVGDGARAADALRAAEAAKPATAPLAVEAELEWARGAVVAADGDVELGLDHLVRASALFGPRDDAVTVDGAAALLAVAAGRDERARQLASGPSTTQVAIRAWLKLRAGEVAAAEADIAAVVAHGDITPRDALLVASVAVGIARRGTDMVRLAAALDMAAAVGAAADADLLTLPVVGDLAAGAVRVAPEEGRRMIEAWIDLVTRSGASPVWSAHLHWWRVQWAAAGSDASAAAAAARDLAQVAERVPRFAPHAQAAAAWAAVLEGDFTAATVTAATDALAEIGLAWEASVIAGAAALRTTEQGAARTLLNKGRDLRARLAVTDTAAGGESDDALSAREREVAALVVDGLTHREIGAQLYISAKTVEHHVANIRQKLGVGTRAEMLAALRTILG